MRFTSVASKAFKSQFCPYTGIKAWCSTDACLEEGEKRTDALICIILSDYHDCKGYLDSSTGHIWAASKLLFRRGWRRDACYWQSHSMCISWSRLFNHQQRFSFWESSSSGLHSRGMNCNDDDPSCQSCLVKAGIDRLLKGVSRLDYQRDILWSKNVVVVCVVFSRPSQWGKTSRVLNSVVMTLSRWMLQALNIF